MRGQAVVTPPVIARTATIIAPAGGAENTARGDRAQGHKFRCRPFMPRHNQRARHQPPGPDEARGADGGGASR
jgi:hypothetical protein